jgi:glycosyltransferase involved in cell wall biosynthesis
MATGTTLIDCRWLGFTGIGTVTEYLLAGLHEIAPPGRWILWGPEAVSPFAWSGADVVIDAHHPLSWAGQRDALSVPQADRSLAMHVIRPLTRRPSLMLVHDTIPLRWGGGRLTRAAWRQYYRASARRCGGVLVNSASTWARVVEDLGVTPVGRVHYPIESERPARIRRQREHRHDQVTRMVYVGRVRPHKNLGRAIEAFAGSTFAREGGRFAIVGADDEGRQLLAPVLERHEGAAIDIVTRCSDAELEELYAGAAFLIQPALEEGYGLTVVEGLAAGIPVCASTAVEEAAQGLAELFDPYSVDDMTRAIDRTADLAAGGDLPPPVAGPTPRQFAEEVLTLPW